MKHGMAVLNSDRPPPSRQLIELLSRALLDAKLCDSLFAEPEAMAKAFDLSPDETQAIKRLDRLKFDQQVARIRSS
jgi:hypothetical protein